MVTHFLCLRSSWKGLIYVNHITFIGVTYGLETKASYHSWNLRRVGILPAYTSFELSVTVIHIVTYSLHEWNTEMLHLQVTVTANVRSTEMSSASATERAGYKSQVALDHAMLFDILTAVNNKQRPFLPGLYYIWSRIVVVDKVTVTVF